MSGLRLSQKKLLAYLLTQLGAVLFWQPDSNLPGGQEMMLNFYDTGP